MKYLSICSGIEAASAAWHSLNWTPVGFAEIEPFPAAVLAHRYPDVPNFGDMTTYEHWNIKRGEFGVLVGGTPCQSFSVAGLRKGLDDDRGNLALVFCELADHFAPEFIVWENVPGVLSDKTNAFGCLLAGLAGEVEALQPPGGKWKNAGLVLGPKRSVAWRTLDAQYFGVAQRRRRVFVVASAGDICASEILFERESLRRDTAPSREAGEGSTASPAQCFEPRSPDGHARLIGDFSPTLNRMGGGQREPCVLTWPAEIAPTLNAHFGEKQGLEDQHVNGGAGLFAPAQPIPLDLRNAGRDPEKHDEINRQGVGVGDEGDPAHTVTTACVHGVAQPIPFDTTQITSPYNYSKPQSGDPCHPLAAGAHVPAIAQPITAPTLTASNDPSRSPQSSEVTRQVEAVHQASMAVRRLTPVECERLQGFPEITKTAILYVCSDQQKPDALAATRCRKSQINASLAGESGLMSSANAVERLSNAGQEKSSEPVLAHVQIDLERQRLQIRSQEKSLLSVSIADGIGWCHPHIQVADFAQLLARLLTWLERSHQVGRVASHQSISSFSHHQSGATYAAVSGQEIDAFVIDAEKSIRTALNLTKSTTSEAGQSSHISEQHLKTLCCCAATVIASFIPEQTQNTSSFAVSVSVSHGYTNIPWRKAEESPDGPRYKALGNSMAVPVMRWIGERIAGVSK